ncbi:hypothetical protein [Haloarcula marina]|uniref:hypothetical protein n=1 Tax=Haloarcula marina TaxID=2961574 RepID=UPI0020B7D1A8|nr:hypothetical protein [Halomicroarcula marina]
MTDAAPKPYRPALVTLTEDVRELTTELQHGLRSEKRVLTWLQEMTIRTLGRLDTRVYSDMTRQFRGSQGVLLAALVVPSKRRGEMTDLDERRAEQLREWFLAHYIHPAHRNSFRRLRGDATEYIDAADDEDAHEATRQRLVAMRPAISELEEWQQRALGSLLDGFEERAEILDWGHDVLLATHGELGKEWVTRVYREQSTVEILTGESEKDAQARRLFAAHYLLPTFRRGVRVLSGRAKESPDVGQTDDTEAPDW